MDQLTIFDFKPVIVAILSDQADRNSELYKTSGFLLIDSNGKVKSKFVSHSLAEILFHLHETKIFDKWLKAALERIKNKTQSGDALMEISVNELYNNLLAICQATNNSLAYLVALAE